MDHDESQPVPTVSVPTLRRLPVYHDYLKRLWQNKIPSVSCTQIAEALNLVAIQVRKDLQVLQLEGKPKVGFVIPELMRAIEDFLGWNNTADAFLVGAGNLGAALLGYRGFQEFGLNIVAGFDVDPAKVGKEIKGKKILPIQKLPDLVRRMSVKIGILTAPASEAQVLADVMVQAGIRAIWNFAPVHVHVPSHIIVQHENLASSLAVLSSKLKASPASLKPPEVNYGSRSPTEVRKSLRHH
jgi:redox-sensing transcriptional repressor